jgi:putative endonuclease
MTNSPRKCDTQNSTRKRQRSHKRGAFAEQLVALWSMLKGHRILARRWSSHAGEIDLIAVRANHLVFIEVKQRETFEAAEASITPQQRQREYDAANIWLARRPKYHQHEIRFDLVFVAPYAWPRHIEGGL